MRCRKLYAALLIVVLVIGAFLVCRIVEYPTNGVKKDNAVSEQTSKFGNSSDKRMLKCWVREQVPKGYDNYGHELQPASIGLKDILIGKSKNQWVIYSKSFSGNSKEEKTYHIKQEVSGTFVLYNSNHHRIGTISKVQLYDKYKEQTI